MPPVMPEALKHGFSFKSSVALPHSTRFRGWRGGDILRGRGVVEEHPGVVRVGRRCIAALVQPNVGYTKRPAQCSISKGFRYGFVALPLRYGLVCHIEQSGEFGLLHAQPTPRGLNAFSYSHISIIKLRLTGAMKLSLTCV